MIARRLFALLLLTAACTRGTPDTPDAAASAVASAAPPPAERRDAILAAEHRRDARAITREDQQSRDLETRRAAARALARIGGEDARAGLLRALADEDDEIIAWGAYGLGFSCKGHEADNVSALIARALSHESAKTSTPPRLDPHAAIARAIGRCAADASEPTLAAWLTGPRERVADVAYALGDLASARQKLREETLVALLNAAAGSASAPPVPEALYPIGRLEHVPLTVLERTREVATARLAEPSDARLFAVRALGNADRGAVSELERVLGSPSTFSPPERAEATKALARHGTAGQRALAAVLPHLAPSADPVAITTLIGDELGVLLATLKALKAPGPAPARRALTDLASFPLPDKAPAAIARRVAWIRCGAAKILAGDNFRDKLLTACDPQANGSIGARAIVEVLGRARLTGPRLTAYRAYATSNDLRAREAALDLLATHEELDKVVPILTSALKAKESGLVSIAAEILSKRPRLAYIEPSKPKGKRKKRKKRDDSQSELVPSPEIGDAIRDALGRPGVTLDPEMAVPLLDAAGALALTDAKARVDELCRAPYPTTREHAEKTLEILTGKKQRCEPEIQKNPLPAELEHLVTKPTTLTFETDVGELSLTLDPVLAPVFVTRVIDLARAGYYDGMVVHRVEPGFVTQFGAPYGDGYGGPEDKPALRCETSPLPFTPLTVGVALAGRDTGSSQLFVMHARHAHLDGRYALVGTAKGPWSAFVDGDLIHHVKITDP